MATPMAERVAFYYYQDYYSRRYDSSENTGAANCG